ncbi:zinc finger protein 3 homolog isoform X1 [Anopheles ziemanni]|nr:zinc finger protein 3 homolog isoform X1 [Anopheles ziemanni]
MAFSVIRLGKICRFCLRRDGLMDLRKATSSDFTVQDVLHYTGIQFSEAETTAAYAICLECCITIKNSVSYRRNCLNNDVTFKRLIAVLDKSGPDKHLQDQGKTMSCSIQMDSISQHSKNAYKPENACDDAGVVTLDDSDSNDSILSLHGESLQVTPKGAIACELYAVDEQCASGNIITKEFPNMVNENNYIQFSDSDDSMPSLYGEAMSEALSDKLLADSSVHRLKHSTEDSGIRETPTSVVEETERVIVPNPVEHNQVSSDGNASDDSMRSLYEEVMEGTEKAKAKPNLDNISHLCPICGLQFRELTNHLNRSHNHEKNFACTHCPKKFKDNFTRKLHINTWHEKRIILTCEHCGQGFTNHSSHFYHIKNSHGKSDVYECETCHRKFKSIDGYNKHLKQHSLTVHSCPHCDKLFKTT